MKERISYIDTTKGILILFVPLEHTLAWHYFFNIEGSNYVYENAMFGIGRIFLPFIMPVFFVLHTLVSSKVRSFKEECINGIKTLLVPMVLLFPMYSIWFCWAMFFAVLIYNLIRKFQDEKKKIICLLFIAFLGIAFSHYGYDWHYIDYAFVLLPFLYLGDKHKWIFTNNHVGIISLVLYTIISLVYLYLDKYPPFVGGEHLWVGRNAPIYYTLATLGCSAIIMIGRWVNKNRFLEYVGRNSMIYFLTHFFVFYAIFNLTEYNLYLSSISDNIPMSIFTMVVTYVVSLGFSTLCSILINKYCPWLTGKGL